MDSQPNIPENYHTKRGSLDLLKSLASKDFYNFYITEIAPCAKEIEFHRYVALVCVTLFITLACFCFSYMFRTFSVIQDKEVWINLIINLSALIFFLIPFILLPVKRYRSKAKELFIRKLLSFWGKFEYYNYQASFWDSFKMAGGTRDYHSGPYNMIEVEDLNMIKTFNLASLDDNLKGVYNGLNLEIQEMNLKYEQGSGKNRTVTTVFNGLLMTVEVRKPFKGSTVLLPDKGAIFNTLETPGGGLQKVHLEDPRFEAAFEVYADDQVEARYLLTTAFMERILKSMRYNPSSRISCEFKDGKMYMGFESEKDWFELPILSTAKNFKNYQRILYEISTFLSVVDTLKLEQNIGL